MNLQQALEATVKKIRSMNPTDVNERLLKSEDNKFVLTLNHLLGLDKTQHYEIEQYSVRESCASEILSSYILPKDINLTYKSIYSSEIDNFDKDYLIAA
ncbi:hypothetical protein [Psychrobacter immobilis]|uniref:hypothetical protein n=1 Tax=Psychrobacter immobilis TaxID=498 RepID=UPI003FD5AA90